MHLAFITNLFPPYIVGGNEMLCEEVVAALRRRGHRVSVICGRGTRLPSDADLRGVLEIDLDRQDETFLGGRLPSPWEAFKLHLFSPMSYRSTDRLLATWEPDLTVVWNLYLASLAPLVAAVRRGGPVVVHAFDKWLDYSLRDLTPLLEPRVAWKRLALRLAQLTVQRWLRHLAEPRRVIAVSRFIKDYYVRNGFRESSIDVELLGIPTADFAFEPRAARTSGDPLRLLFAGGLWQGKGPLTAIQALAILNRSAIPVNLDVCGDGAPRFVDVLRRMIDALGVADRVTMHGRVPRAEVRRFCQTLDVLVFPSEWDEPFAAVPLEAMSCGMAVVATTAGGTPEAVVDGETGLLVPPREPEALAAAVRRLAIDDDLRLRLGQQAARVVRERFDFEHYVDRLETRYRHAAAEGRPKRR